MGGDDWCLAVIGSKAVAVKEYNDRFSEFNI